MGSNMLIDVTDGQNGTRLKGAKELLPNQLNYEKRNTEVQVGGEGGADIRIVNCFVTVFLSLSLLAFTLAFPGFSARETGQQYREIPERLARDGLMSSDLKLVIARSQPSLTACVFLYVNKHIHFRQGIAVYH